MWTTIGLTVGGLVLIGGVLWMTYRLAYSKGRSEVRQAIAESESERRQEHAVEAAKPMSREPFTGPGGLFDK